MASEQHQIPQPAPMPSRALPAGIFTNALPDVFKQLDGTATTQITTSGVLVAF